MSVSASPSARVVSIHRSDNLHEAFKALLLAAGRPVTAQYLARAVHIPEKEVVAALSAASDESNGIVIAWDGTNAELAVGSKFGGIVYAAAQFDATRSRSLIEEYLSAQRQRGRAQSTIDAYRSFLVRFARDVGRPVDEVETRDIRRFLMREETERKNSLATLASKIHKLSAMYKWLLREELVKRNPMARIDAPKLPDGDDRYLTHEEIERVRDVAKGFNRMLFEVLYSSGIRREEASNLDWQDINLDSKTLFVRNGKGGKSRTTMLSTRAVMLLREHRTKRTDDEPWVFRSQYQRRMSKTSINRRIKGLGAKAKLREPLTPHRLRHSMAKHLRDADIPLDVIQGLLGHADLRTTQRYSGLPEHSAHYYRTVFP